MNGAKIKLNALTDPNGTGAKNQHLFAALSPERLIFTAEYGIVIGRGCRKLRRTGIHHLIGRRDAMFIAHGPDLLLPLSRQTGNHSIRKFQALCLL